MTHQEEKWSYIKRKETKLKTVIMSSKPLVSTLTKFKDPMSPKGTEADT